MMGIWAKRSSCLIARAASKPSIRGITASIRIRSGTACSISARALRPSDATSAVMPAFSNMADIMPSVSEASSTARITGFLGASGILAHHPVDGGAIAVQIAIFRQPPQEGQGMAGIGLCRADLIQLGEDTVEMADAAQLLQFGQ